MAFQNSFNFVVVAGKIGKDPELKGEKDRGEKFAVFSVATNEIWKSRDKETKKKATWHTVVVWNKNLAKFCADYLKKGSLVLVAGKEQVRYYGPEDARQKSVEINADQVIPLSKSPTAVLRAIMKEYGDIQISRAIEILTKQGAQPKREQEREQSPPPPVDKEKDPY
jgi:single-strand DNA-binding protein